MMCTKRLLEKPCHSYISNLQTDGDYKQLYLKTLSRSPKNYIEAAREDPWHSLHEKPTFSTLRRYGINRYACCKRNDALDYSLLATCNQHKDWPIDKNGAVKQPETANERCLCMPPRSTSVQMRYNHPVRLAPIGEKPTNINNVKLAIECPHISQTNRGYSRKPENGTFYRS